jgi:hypothetical protein
MRLNNDLTYIAAMNIEVAATTATMSTVGAIQGAILTLICHLEQEKSLDRLRQRFTCQQVPYEKAIYIGEAFRR